MAADKYRCKACLKNVAATGQSPSPLRYRKHTKDQGEECDNSRTIIPAWIVKRGPETDEDDRPVIGRDYAPCPACGRSPLLDADGKFADHIKEPGVPSDQRENCPMSGQPYTPEGEECPATDTPTPEASADSACSAPSTPPTSPSANGPAPEGPPGDSPQSPPPSQPSTIPNESEEMISKWAATARAIEDRQLPPPSPESTTTLPKSPPPTPGESPSGDTSPDPVPCHIAQPHPPHEWMHRRQATPCPGKPAPTTAPTASAPVPNSAEDAAAASEAAPSSTDSSEGFPPSLWETTQQMAKEYSEDGTSVTFSIARTPDTADPANASPAPAAPTSAAKDDVLPPSRPEPSLPPPPAAVRTSTADAEPSTAATPPTPAAAPPSSDVPPDIKALAGIFPEKPPPPGEPWYVPDAGGGPPIDIRSLKVVSQNDDGSLTLELKDAPLFVQPGSPFSQPGKVEPAPAAVPMSVMGEQVAAAMRQLFFDYGNRKTDDNRSAQTTLGPSEIGTPCDRRLAMSLLGIPAVNPGGDRWAAFVGTAVHAALAAMFEWADAGTGRYAVETPLQFPSALVPKGTADLLDRTLVMVDDHKVQGKWSHNKLRTEGIPPGYRVQLHVYGYGQRLAGETVDYVALISWPREASSLDDLYVVVEPYNPQIARDALARVDRIAAEVQAYETERAQWAGLDINAHSLGIARQFPVADDCKFCAFHAPGDPGMTRGCPGPK